MKSINIIPRTSLSGLMYIGIFSLSFLLFSGCSSSRAPRPEEIARQKNIKRLLDTRSFEFIPQSAQPLGGQNLLLNATYSVSVNKDSLVSYLPYFGVAYSAPLNVLRGPLDFASSSFSYSSNSGKRGNTQIVIAFKDQRDPRRFYLDITANGYATLNVQSDNRQSISFSGRIEKSPVKN